MLAFYFHSFNHVFLLMFCGFGLNSGKNESKSVLEFLKNEVLSEERVIYTLARTCFGFDRAKKTFQVTRSHTFHVDTTNDLTVGNTSKDKSFA
ncbi:hypothetical protein NPIL_313411 [Nephila pilipes]|uniref:Uncharacterized protein n=1 Tax=Nephila pilipes TaxID=299642 RepID=A0A8X6KPI8_NEPPI|nr:hypothetical protein NPIL_323701 [Nephila pilipes]GFT30260.1 hypothetical protein NPIL_313411 [Nephila pilipes]